MDFWTSGKRKEKVDGEKLKITRKIARAPKISRHKTQSTKDNNDGLPVCDATFFKVAHSPKFKILTTTDHVERGSDFAQRESANNFRQFFNKEIRNMKYYLHVN